jgi:hypothetical protein
MAGTRTGRSRLKMRPWPSRVLRSSSNSTHSWMLWGLVAAMGYYFVNDSDRGALEQRWMLCRQRGRDSMLSAGPSDWRHRHRQDRP